MSLPVPVSLLSGIVAHIDFILYIFLKLDPNSKSSNYHFHIDQLGFQRSKNKKLSGRELNPGLQGENLVY